MDEANGVVKALPADVVGSCKGVNVEGLRSVPELVESSPVDEFTNMAYLEAYFRLPDVQFHPVHCLA